MQCTLRGFAVMVQRDAAGSLRVSLSPIFVLPLRAGVRGLMSNLDTLAAGFALLYPPYTCASWANLARATPSGRAEGRSPSAFSPIPQDWGIQGV
jgi:hypothetical protein